MKLKMPSSQNQHNGTDPSIWQHYFAYKAHARTKPDSFALVSLPTLAAHGLVKALNAIFETDPPSLSSGQL